MRLAITLGDPRGIGAEIVRKALASPKVSALGAEWVVVGPSGTEQPVDVSIGDWDAQAPSAASAGRLAGRAIERAAQMALAGEVHGMVTAPLDKAALHAGGYDYPGHTEMLGVLAGCHTTMMLASERLRVVLATTHIALRDVVGALTHDVIVETARATIHGLRDGFGISEPRVALCALNPHAGDGGRFGTEDDALLAPAARAAGIAGPFPADTVFVRALSGEFDAVIAPYHDVGMTAIKVASFGSAVNITFGLPFVRTSPDHGTALDIAGLGIASAASMIVAMEQAVRLARRGLVRAEQGAG
ncbi:MAG: 4-hydroxythreonine-4-phosphate dehydrogenase PdxA [Gemmatimonadaceae bacterium]|nr:4-hydroxythreonine-4-phosphate dehydrogenase PdxA [Gemmatimonadaceae bacterium]